ncbi:unnamed protein product [Amoebophrya sp. A25]|nr:unnamed protein product [Amoebophrya sp. A25]|eukprot:GSA25T00003546001.1
MRLLLGKWFREFFPSSGRSDAETKTATPAPRSSDPSIVDSSMQKLLTPVDLEACMWMARNLLVLALEGRKMTIPKGTLDEAQSVVLGDDGRAVEAGDKSRRLAREVVLGEDRLDHFMTSAMLKARGKRRISTATSARRRSIRGSREEHEALEGEKNKDPPPASSGDEAPTSTSLGGGSGASSSGDEGASSVNAFSTSKTGTAAAIIRPPRLDRASSSEDVAASSSVDIFVPNALVAVSSDQETFLPASSAASAGYVSSTDTGGYGSTDAEEEATGGGRDSISGPRRGELPPGQSRDEFLIPHYAEDPIALLNKNTSGSSTTSVTGGDPSKTSARSPSKNKGTPNSRSPNKFRSPPRRTSSHGAASLQLALAAANQVDEEGNVKSGNPLSRGAGASRAKYPSTEKLLQMVATEASLSGLGGRAELRLALTSAAAVQAVEVNARGLSLGVQLVRVFTLFRKCSIHRQDIFLLFLLGYQFVEKTPEVIAAVVEENMMNSISSGTGRGNGGTSFLYLEDKEDGKSDRHAAVSSSSSGDEQGRSTPGAKNHKTTTGTAQDGTSGRAHDGTSNEAVGHASASSFYAIAVCAVLYVVHCHVFDGKIEFADWVRELWPSSLAQAVIAPGKDKRTKDKVAKENVAKIYPATTSAQEKYLDACDTTSNEGLATSTEEGGVDEPGKQGHVVVEIGELARGRRTGSNTVLDNNYYPQAKVFRRAVSTVLRASDFRFGTDAVKLHAHLLTLRQHLRKRVKDHARDPLRLLAVQHAEANTTGARMRKMFGLQRSQTFSVGADG